MAQRKTKRRVTASLIGQELKKLAPENAASIEEAVQNAATIASLFGMEPTTVADYDRCEKNHIRYRGVCHKCPVQEETC